LLVILGLKAQALINIGRIYMDNEQPKPQLTPTGTDEPTNTQPLPAMDTIAPQQQTPFVPPTQPTAQAPLQNQQMSQAMPFNPAKKNKSKTLLVALISLVILAAIGAGAYFFLSKNESKTDSPTSTNNNQDSNNSSSEDTSVSADSIIAIVDTKFKELADLQGGSYENNLPEYNLTVSAKNDDYYIDVESSSDLSYSITDIDSDKIVEGLDLVFTENGFEKTDSGQLDGEASVSYLNNYESEDLRCSMVTDDSDYNVGVSCVELSKISNAIAEMLPFIKDIQTNSSFSAPQSYGFSSNERYEGKNDYKIKTVFTNPPVAYYFLQKPDSSEWQYFGPISYQSPEECTLYESNEDAKLAFEGNFCLDENNNESEVKAN